MHEMMKALKMSCKDISPLISEERDRPLSFLCKLRLNIHLSMCKMCVAYKKQMALLCKLVHSLGKEESTLSEEHKLKPEVKEKLQKWIEDKK